MPSIPTLPGIASARVATPRLTMHVLTSGPADGTPVLFVHSNASSNTFWEEVMLALPAGFRAIAPDLRGYGSSDDAVIDATRGVFDWVDDLLALKDALGISKYHVAGHSLGAVGPDRGRLGRHPLGDAGRARFAVRLRRHQGRRWHTHLRRLRGLRRRPRQPRDGQAHVQRRPRHRRPGLAAQRDERALLEAAVPRRARGGAAVVDAQREDGPRPLPWRLGAVGELAGRGARGARAEQRDLAEIRRLHGRALHRGGGEAPHPVD